MYRKSEQVLTLNDIVKAFNVHPKTVHKWFKMGLKHKVLENGYYQVERKDLDDFISEQDLPRPWRIILADDDKKYLGLLLKPLEKQGFHVMTSSNLLDVVAKIKKFKPDLLVLDIMFGEDNSLDILEEYRDDGDIPEVPILFVSGKVEKKDVLDRCMRFNCVGFMEKPFKPMDLADEARQILVNISKI